MGTSQRTFDQVKNILGKLDQRIDSLRTGRTTPPPPPTPTFTGPDSAPGLHSTVGRGSASNGTVPQPALNSVGLRPATGPTPAAAPAVNNPVANPATAAPNAPSRSAYGRATPIRQAS